MQMVQFSATRYSITLTCESVYGVLPPQRVFVFVVVYFVIDSVRRFLDTPSYSF
jgi:hypothetical protein